MPEDGMGLGALLRLLLVGPLRRGIGNLDGPGWLRLVAFASLACVFEAALYGVFRSLAEGLWSQPVLGPVLGARLLSLALSLLFCLMLFSSMPAFLGRLLFASDAAFFVASPMDPQAYFKLRLAQTALASAWALPLLWLPAVLALRGALHGGCLFLLWGLVAPLPMAVLAAAIGSGLLCALLTFLPPRRLKAGLAVAAGLLFSVVIAALFIARPERLADPQRARSVETYLAGLRALDVPWSPGAWAARAVLLEGPSPWSAAACLLLSLTVAALAWTGVVALFGGWAFEAWGKGQQAFSGGVGGAHRAFRWTGRRAPWRVLLERDALALIRAPGQAAQALLLAALLLLFGLSLGRLPLGGDQQLKDWLYLPVCAVAQVLLVAVAGRFVFPGPSLVGGATWLLYHAPVRARDHVLARALLGVLLLSPLGLLLGFQVNRVFTPPGVAGPAGWACFIATPISLACLNAGLGLAWARDADHPEAVLASPAGVAAMGFGLLLVLVQNALLAPLMRLEYESPLPGRGASLWTISALVFLVVLPLHAVAACVPLRLGARAVGDGT